MSRDVMGEGERPEYSRIGVGLNLIHFSTDPFLFSLYHETRRRGGTKGTRDEGRMSRSGRREGAGERG